MKEGREEGREEERKGVSEEGRKRGRGLWTKNPVLQQFQKVHKDNQSALQPNSRVLPRVREILWQKHQCESLHQKVMRGVPRFGGYRRLPSLSID